MRAEAYARAGTVGRVLASGRGRAGAGGLAGLAVAAVAGAWWWPYAVDDFARGGPAPPGWPHLMGTTTIGQDVVALVLRGTGRTLAVATTAAAGAAVAGILVGATAGHLRGWADAVLMRSVDLVLTLPPLALLVVLTSRVSSTSPVVVGLVLALTLCAPFARVVRSLVLSSRDEEYVLAARALGASRVRVLARHVVPAAMPVVAASTTVTAAAAILAETGLAYLGFGVVPPDTSLGTLIARGQDQLATAPWVFFFPGATVVVIVLLLSTLGDAVQDASDLAPRRR